MFFKSALAALISISLVVVPAASASAQAYYLGEKNVPDDMPRPKDHPPEAGMEWRCDKNSDTGKWSWPCAGWVWKKAPEPKTAQAAPEPNIGTISSDCNTGWKFCRLPANMHPHYPTGSMFKLVDPSCAPGPPTKSCVWENTLFVQAAPVAPVSQPAPAPKPEKEPKRYGAGTMLAVGLLGLVAGAALGANGGRGSYYNGYCYCYTSYRDAGSAYNTYRQR